MAPETLANGSKLGPYEIVSPLGAGGMGEVYLAKDTRLDRQVAIKVLPGHVAADPDLKARFEREARSISSLNHPNICSLYDIGNQGGIEYLVMEHLQGETLAARLERGPVPTSELLRYATQIADALDKAHRQGLIHRDLKSLNIMITKNGAKLLDFGLAKLLPTPMTEMTGLTHTTPLTGQGAIVGTLQYMSPEQLEGKECDARSDLFSFGVLLYEMATGKRPFSGTSQARLIASIISDEPRSVTTVQPDIPPALDRVIRQCLAKDPDDRWQSARDLLHQLKWVDEGGSLAGIPAPVAARRKQSLRLGWLLAGVSGAVAVTLGILYFGQHPPRPRQVAFSVVADPAIRTMSWPMISPDGSMLAFRGVDSNNQSMVWVRRMEALKAQPLAGTEGALRPFWSPDSKMLAFMQGDQLMKVSASGGPVQLIATVPTAADGSWGSKDVILLDGTIVKGDAIRAVNASGGTVKNLVEPTDSSSGTPSWPCFLPDGEHFLYQITPKSANDNSPNSSLIMLGSLSGAPPTRLFPSSSRAVYDPAGYILNLEGKILTARSFNPAKPEKIGDPMAVTSMLGTNAVGQADMSVSQNGILVYAPPAQFSGSELVETDRNGKPLQTLLSGKEFRDLQLSPEGQRLVYGVVDPAIGTEDIWTFDLSRKTNMRATFDRGVEFFPIWAPDGNSILYTSSSHEYNLFRKSMSVDGDGTLFLKRDSGSAVIAAGSWGKLDGPIGLTRAIALGGQSDVGLVYPGPPARFEWIAATPFAEGNASISPDGRFLLYTSQETGSRQVYVRQLDGKGEKWQISTQDGSTLPLWRRDGKELYFWNNRTNSLSAVATTLGPTLQVGTTTTLFEVHLETSGFSNHRYDVTPDGQKFYINRQGSLGLRPEFVVMENWAVDFESKRK